MIQNALQWSRAAALRKTHFRGTMWPMTAPTTNVVGSPPGRVRYQPLVIVLAAAAMGIVADRFRPLPLGAWWVLAVGALVIWTALRLVRREPRAPETPRPPGVLANLVLLLAVAATAAGWHHCRWYLLAADDLGRYARGKRPAGVRRGSGPGVAPRRSPLRARSNARSA